MKDSRSQAEERQRGGSGRETFAAGLPVVIEFRLKKPNIDAAVIADAGSSQAAASGFCSRPQCLVDLDHHALP